MESLKPILLLIVLSGVGYGVYVALNHAPAPEPTSGATTDGNPAANQSGSPSTRDNHEDAPVPAAKSGSSGAGLGMSGILKWFRMMNTLGSRRPRNAKPTRSHIWTPRAKNDAKSTRRILVASKRTSLESGLTAGLTASFV